MSSAFSLILYNARSICNKLFIFKRILLDVSPGIVAVTESWCHDGIPDSVLEVEGYCLFRSDRKNRVGGGVLLYMYMLKTIFVLFL